MALEDYQEIVAIPRMHEEFLPGGSVKALDPTGQNSKAYAACPAFCWNRQYALQYLKDLQENTARLAGIFGGKGFAGSGREYAGACAAYFAYRIS